jgi:hypothetical protein
MEGTPLVLASGSSDDIMMGSEGVAGPVMVWIFAACLSACTGLPVALGAVHELGTAVAMVGVDAATIAAAYKMTT